MTEVSSPYQIQTLQSEELLAETRAISAVWKTDLRPLLLQIETEPDRYPEQRLQARAIASELERRLNEVLTLSEQRRRELSAETNRVVKGLIGGTGQLLVGFATVVTLMALLAGLAIRNLMRSEREKDQDRRKLEDLNAQLLKYSDVALLTEDLVIIADADSRIEWVNPAFERQTGYTLAEARGRTTSELLHGPDTDPEMARFIEERIAEGHGFKLQILNYSKDQMPYWVDADVRPGVVDAVLIRAHPRTPDMLQLQMVRIKTDGARPPPNQVKRLHESLERVSAKTLYACFDDGDLHFVETDTWLGH